MTPREHPIRVLARHSLANLPDSMSERRQVLEALLELLPRHHENRQEVRNLLSTLDQHLLLQRELPFGGPAKGAR